MDGLHKRFTQRRSLGVLQRFGHSVHEGRGVLHLLLFPLTVASQDPCSCGRIQDLTDLLLGQLDPLNAGGPPDRSHDVQTVQSLL